jgi:hypothetical protein
MSALAGSVVDSKALLQTVGYSLLAGIGVTFIFSIAIFGFARFGEMGREGRSPSAVAFGGLAVLATIAFAAAIVLGIIVMTSK